MATQTSSKFDRITSKRLIQSGSPAVYQLTPKKMTSGTLRRMTLGEKQIGAGNKTILLVGETGTGKSTLINALVNFTMGVTWEDDVWFQIVEDQEEKELEGRNQSESQTSDVIVYQIFGFEGQTLPFSLTIIDTPGYGDTRSVDKDDIVKQRLFDLFRADDGIHEIDAVGLVLKATENRVSDRLRYIFDSVVSLFGKDMEKKIVALITHSDGMPPDNVLTALADAKITFAKDENNEPVYFQFNNRQTVQKTKKTNFPLKNAWGFTMEEIRQFSDFLGGNSAQNVTKTVEVLNSRIKLTACIQNLEERIQLTEMKQKEIQQTQEALKKYEHEMESNANFVIEVEEPYKVKENITGGWWGWGWLGWQWQRLFYEGAVCCTTCEETCHYPGCTIAWSAALCEVMKDGHCTSCTKNCPVSSHVKEEWIYVNKTRKVQKTLQDVKDKYEANRAKGASELSLLETLQGKMHKHQKEKNALLEESYQHVIKLEGIALKSNSLSTHVHLDFLIARMKEIGDSAKVFKLEGMKRQVEKDKGIKAAMNYGFNKLAKAARDGMM
ncbi:uncharacterized protein [Brachionichthys hirsutus]|uniref:uncharacterized protein n=1 Tax=Brachionichthys hirsutus TaxID=412623 RepID=UPI0036044DE5